MKLTDQVNAATRRYRDTTEERAALERRKARDGVRVVDTPEQVTARVDRLSRAGMVHTGSLLRTVPQPPDGDRLVLLESIIGLTSELQAANFLARGARVAATVGRIVADGLEPRSPWGTGFLIAPSLLLTNNHVLPDAGAASSALLELNYERDLDHQPTVVATYRLDPEALFVTDERLDYTVVAVTAGPGGTAPGDTFGWNRLIREQGKIVTGEPVNVIGHPAGRRKEIAIRENSLLYQLDDFLQYDADTQPGSSGSPAYNDQWEVVALHHAGVPATDDNGNWLSIDGGPADPDRPDRVRWLANEGVRVSVLLRDLLGRELSDAQRRLLTTMGPQALPAPSAPERTERFGAGLRAAGPAGASGTHLVFLHGRAQQGRDPARLRSGWLAGLVAGLSRGAFASVDAADVWFPFYGDVLAAAVPESLSGRPSAEVVIDHGTTAFTVAAPAEESTRALYAHLLEQAAARAGMPVPVAAGAVREGFGDDLIHGARRALGWLAARSRLDEVVIATVFRDVAAYLDQPAVRERVLGAVLGCLPGSGRLVLVGHSLGSVVALDLISRLPSALSVDVLVTAGSPLGLDSVSDRLLTPPPRLARPVGTWVNAWSPADAVAIGCPLADDWPQAADVITANADGRAHDIAEYLSDARVAQAIGTALR
ncbi:trypsin-like peptidase domain-containing protein [Actinoplanes sp. NPDC023801]|uniref:trypsin-like peptidase domain-containing protein n=1 Tax=Actinoplanes sp. NPDC023801 TaxID=3154595 RepID=UPI0033DAA22F